MFTFVTFVFNKQFTFFNTKDTSVSQRSQRVYKTDAKLYFPEPTVKTEYPLSLLSNLTPSALSSINTAFQDFT